MAISSTLTEFKTLMGSYNAVSISEQVVFDVQSPLSSLYHVLSEPEFVFLEGISEQVKQDRFSYLGLDPYLRIRFTHDACHLNYDDGRQEKRTGNLYEIIQSILDTYQINPNNPAYSCGLMGTLSYEAMTHLEDIPTPEKRDLDTPIASFMIPRSVLIFDNLYHTLTLVRTVFQDDVNSSSLEDLYHNACETIATLKHKLFSPLSSPIPILENKINHYQTLSFDCNISKEKFMADVARCKDYIKAGDIFQIQVSRRAFSPFNEDPIQLYRYVRNYNPSPFLFYLKFDDTHLIGASPEILVGVENRVMTIRPLAGTRRRYSKKLTEDEIIQELISDDKEIAEHVMLVDLARHEVSRACDIGSVKVNELMNVEKYTHVMHMVSDVSGQLRPECSAVDALKYGFPAGTVTGTPKIRAMEIISELESEQREFYSGGVVYFDFEGNLKSCLTIRSMFVKDKVVYTQAAAGIVADSVPELEFKETENKMRSCLSAIHQFSGGA